MAAKFILKQWGGGSGLSDPGQVMAESQALPTQETAENAIQWVKDNAPGAGIDVVRPRGLVDRMMNNKSKAADAALGARVTTAARQIVSHNRRA